MEEASNPQPQPPNQRLNLTGLLYIACLLASFALLFLGPHKAPPQPETTKISGFKKFLTLDLNKEAIGVARLDGVISMERRGVFFGESQVDKVKKTLEKMAKKNNVKAIILKINSPGGTVASCQEIVAQIEDVRQNYKKPVIAMLGDVAASGGYFVASAADAIVADAGTLTGSIGVIMQTGNFQGLMGRLGITFSTIKSGKFKDIGSPFRAMTEEERALLQNLINMAYGQFVQAVSDGRGIPADQVKTFADGRIFIGEEALKLKLVDSTGGFKEALNLAKKLGRIKGEPALLSDWDLKEEIIQELFPVKSLLPIWPMDKLPSGLLYLWPGY